MKAVIIVECPTHYQYDSARQFNLSNCDNSPISSAAVYFQEFSRVIEARSHLKEQAARYYDGDMAAIRYHKGHKWNSMTIAAATARIITGDEAMEFLKKHKAG